MIPISATTFGMISAPPMPDKARTSTKPAKEEIKPLIVVKTRNQSPPMSRMFVCP